MNTISIVMPVYNSEKFLRESIESILNQTYKDFEFIIINDGSTDNSLKIINKYSEIDNRIIMISRENKGLVYSLNEGMHVAKYDYIARMDADDIAMPQRLQKQIDFLEKNEEIDILGTMVSVIGDISEEEKVKNEKRLNIIFEDENVRKKIINYWYCLAHSSIMLKKSVIKKLNGYMNCKSEDLNLWLRALKSGFKIYKINERLIQYRIHNESKSSIDNKEYEGLKDGIIIKLEDVFGKENMKSLKYLIWGAGNGGKITKQIVSSYFNKANCIGFIDKYKTGTFAETEIFKPEEIKNIIFDYVFIATEPGKEEAISKLNDMGLKSISDFMCTV